MASTVLANIKRGTQATCDALNRWDFDAIMAVRSDDFIVQLLPKTLNLDPMDKEQYRALWDNFLTPSFTDFKMVPLFSAYDPENRKSVVHYSVSANFPIGPRTYELIQMLTFDETGEKSVRLDEYFDSKFYVDISAQLQAAGKASSDA